VDDVADSVNAGHMASLKFFSECWEGAGWRPVEGCASWQSHLGTLCSDFLESSCVASQHVQCDEVSEMCSSPMARHHYAMSFRQIVGEDQKREPLFMHIPKNAGTAVEEAGFHGGRQWGLHWMGGLMRMSDQKLCVKYHVPPRYLEGNPYGDAEVFCVTRHPFERAVSEYTYLLGVEWGSAFSGFLRTEAECSPAGLNTFLQSELSIFLNNTGGSKFRCDCHFLPQSEYIWDADGTQRCQRWIRMEELPGGFNAYMKEKHMPVRLRPSRVNAASCNVTVDDLSDMTKALLEVVYAEDFQRLGYNVF